MRGLDRKIDIERKSESLDELGQPIEQPWTKIASRRAAAISPVRGDERFTAEQFVAKQQVAFTIRYSADVADLSPLDRIVYPAGPADESPTEEPAESDIYDIIEVAELGRREGLRIVAARRAEVG